MRNSNFVFPPEIAEGIKKMEKTVIARAIQADSRVVIEIDDTLYWVKAREYFSENRPADFYKEKLIVHSFA